MKLEPLGIKKLEAIHYYVRDLERSRRFYTQLMDFAEIGGAVTKGQRSVLFRAGECNVLCSQPTDADCRAARFLKKHPDGVGTLVFEVEEIEKTFRLLEERGGTPITDVEVKGGFRTFSITTPFGDTTFRFVERRGTSEFFPGFVPLASPTGGKNKFGFTHFDHVTSNFQTMKPALLWMEHVFGMERFWEVQFHTADVNGKVDQGSGLRSIVMADPHSHVKFANNEPWRPRFKASQINIFNEDLRGDGVQHVALAVPDIISTVRGLRAQGIQFMPTPASYYELLPERIEKTGIQKIDEEIAILKELEILVDGGANHSYLLQIFLKESAGLYGDPAAGPFFYEIIQRKGDQGFGAGNFRALFESIEREQSKEGRA
jgi:4-hydroxyphenylpyruvate dioxygenase